MLLQRYELLGSTGTWWDHSQDWSAAMDGHRLFRKKRRAGAALCVRNQLK